MDIKKLAGASPLARLGGFNSFNIRRERQPGFGPVVREPRPSEAACEAQRHRLSQLQRPA